jgi:hypothetical protein
MATKPRLQMKFQRESKLKASWEPVSGNLMITSDHSAQSQLLENKTTNFGLTISPIISTLIVKK